VILDMPKKLRIVLDTNILISAIIFKGKPREIYDFALNEKYTTITSPSLLSELTGILVKRFLLSLAEINFIEHEIREIFEVVHPKESLYVVRDVDDNRVLEAAVEGQCQYIITGDKDLLVLESFQKIEIVTPEQFLNK
jgi:putative PIN family toxin of toxin-antitoxin system